MIVSEAKYETIMRVKLTTIGNSKGVRLPKSVLQECQVEEEGFELEVKDGSIVLHPVRGFRAEWEEHFKAMAEAGGDVLLDEETSTEFDEEDWQW